MKRKANRRTDPKHFSRVAARSRAVNLGYSIMRGGIRF